MPLLSGLTAGAALHATKGIIRKGLVAGSILGLNWIFDPSGTSNMSDDFFELAYGEGVKSTQFSKTLSDYFNTHKNAIINDIDILADI